MTHPAIPFHKSLSGRMLLLGVLPTAVILLGIIVYVAGTMYTTLRSENERSMQLLADNVAAEIERGSTRAVLAVQIMASAQETGMFGNRAASVEYARQVLAHNREFTAAYFGYEPNADGRDAESIAPGNAATLEAAMGDEGRFIPYWFRDREDNTQLKLEPLVDMETSLYYQGCKQLYLDSGRRRSMVTEPYVYEGKMIVEQTHPIVIGDRFLGIAGVDRALSDIEAFLLDIKRRDGVDIFLVSRAGRFVAETTGTAGATNAADDDELRTRDVADTAYAALFGPLYERRSEKSFQLAADPLDGERYYYASAPVPTGDWMVIIRRLEATVTAPVRSQLATVFSLVAVGVIAVIALSLWVTRATAARIRSAVAAADRVAVGDLSAQTELDATAEDETGRLSASFNHLLESYQAITRMCLAIAQGDFSQRFQKRSNSDVLAEALNEMSERRRFAEEEVNQARHEAEAANRAKSAFLANMSHELRTPMNAILGYSEMLIEEAHDLEQSDFVPDLQKIHEAGEHLLSLINDVLDLSKVEAGRMELYLETFDVGSVVQAVASTVQPLVEKNANQLVVECDGELGEMHADMTKLRQSLLNLLSNAAKFTEGGALTLAVTRDRESDRVRFDVSDTGIGISPDRIERLFEEFAQADETTTRNFGGTGLGLAISRRFCRMMGGDITATSELGVGSKFSIELPAHIEDEAAAGRPAEVGELPEGEGALVLVIDDDATARDLIQRTLTRDGFRVVTADNGEEGLRLASEIRPVAITLDVIMPGTDGWSVLSALKADPELHEIPVVMVSMLDEDRLGYALGAAEFMTKPVDRGRLSQMLARYKQGDATGRVLIVEDEMHVRDMLRRLVEQEGWEASLAENGREGLERVAEARPTLIFTDLMMPVMDGFDFVDELRRHEEWKGIPVIVLTAKDLTEEERARLSGQVERILDKGSQSREDLLNRLHELVGSPQSK